MDYHESDLETAIINNLHEFLMQLGRGYAFVVRQQHPSGCWIDGYIYIYIRMYDETW